MRHLALVKALPKPAESRKSGTGRVSEAMLKCSYRPPDSDFYCWRFKIWYNTLDCAYRTRHRSFDGCSKCSQGDFNLKSRRRDLALHPVLGGDRR